MKFGITILHKRAPKEWIFEDENAVIAEITIGEFREEFGLPIQYWTIDMYINQWADAINRVLKGQKSALITQIYNPSKKSYGYEFGCWPMHLDGEDIKIHNQYYPNKKFKGNLNLSNIYDLLDDFVPNNQVTEEDAISEWVISVDDLLEFRETLNQYRDEVKQQ